MNVATPKLSDPLSIDDLIEDIMKLNIKANENSTPPTQSQGSEAIELD